MPAKNSLNLGYLGGVKIHVHCTFGLLIAWIFAVYLMEGRG